LVPTGQFEYENYLPLPTYVEDCGSGQGQRKYYLGVVVNLLYFSLSYLIYLYLIIKLNYSIKFITLLNLLIIILTIIIFFLSKMLL